jgi:hypothetical protein
MDYSAAWAFISTGREFRAEWPRHGNCEVSNFDDPSKRAYAAALASE